MTLLVFDSGIGGLGVVAEIRRLGLGAGVRYLADTGFYPYGERADDVLIARILEVVGAGIEVVRPDVVVVACNTASTIALAALRAAFDVPFVGCVPPVKPAAAASVTRHIGLLATSATIRRPYLQGLVDEFAGGCVVHGFGTPVLADMAERKFRGVPVDMAALAAAVAPVFEGDGVVDAVALGCTHYTFLLPEFLALRPDVAWFDPAGAVARQVARVAGARAGGGGEGVFFSTARAPDDASMLQRIAGYGFSDMRLLGEPAAFRRVS